MSNKAVRDITVRSEIQILAYLRYNYTGMSFFGILLQTYNESTSTESREFEALDGTTLPRRVQ